MSDENLKYPVWKLCLYQLQNEAPKPSAVFCQEKIENIPAQYGLEFHGSLHRYKCQELLIKEGNYLVRSNKCNGTYTLSLRFSGVVKHYKLYYDGQHFVGEKKFNVLEDLISDGLVTLYLESKASKFLLQLPSVDYKQSPYFTLNRTVIKSFSKNNNQDVSECTYQSACVNNLSRVGGTSNDEHLKSEGLQIPNECLNIKFDKRRSLSDELPCDEKNLRNCSQILLNSCLEVSEIAVSDRPHHFYSHSFSGLHWCGFCGNFLWGIILQGVKCSDCGLKAHRPCSLRIPNDCCPDLKNLKCIFGMDLSTSIDEATSEDQSMIPFIVKKCITEIEARGITKEGIYRVSGSHDEIDTLRLAFEKDEKVIIDEKAVPDINAVAGLLKLYFRLLPLKLITADCFRKLLDSNKLSILEERILATKNALEILPLPHYYTLKFLIKHLGRVCEYSSFNKMSATALSIIFGPTLINAESEFDQILPEDLLALKLTAPEPKIIEMLIILHKDIFS